MKQRFSFNYIKTNILILLCLFLVFNFIKAHNRTNHQLNNKAIQFITNNLQIQNNLDTSDSNQYFPNEYSSSTLFQQDTNYAHINASEDSINLHPFEVIKKSFKFDTLHKKILIVQKDTVYDTLSIQNKELFDAIYFWLGFKYKYAGIGIKGIDCSSLVQQVYKNCYNIIIPRSSFEQFKKTSQISYEEIKEGDFVFFKTRRRRKRKQISHVGIYLNKGYFFHASVSSGVTISSMIEEYYKKHLAAYGRYDNIE